MMAPAIVFVHLGPKIPDYLRLNLQRTRAMFPHQRLVLIVDSGRSVRKLSFLEDIEIFWYNKDSLVESGLEVPKLSHESNFWDGYWQKTFERLYAIGSFQEANPDTPLVHVESDVVLFPAFPMMELLELKKLAWPKVSAEMDVASIVFSPNYSSYLAFLSEISRIGAMDPLTTDMRAMSVFATKNPELVIALPTTFGSMSTEEAELQPLLPHNFECGIFDGLTLGYWFTGRDPKNSWGVCVRYLTPLQSPLNFSAMTFESSGRDLRMLTKGPAKNPVQIYCLHVHSKRLGYFSLDNQAFLKREVIAVNQRKMGRTFQAKPLAIHLKTHGRDLLLAAVTPEKWRNLLLRLVAKSRV